MEHLTSKYQQAELLVLADGKILAHNITPEIAAILSTLDPQNELMRQRAGEKLPAASHPPLQNKQ